MWWGGWRRCIGAREVVLARAVHGDVWLHFGGTGDGEDAEGGASELQVRSDERGPDGELRLQQRGEADVDGQPGYHTGPPGAASWSNGEQYTWGYDAMARLNSIQQTSPAKVSVISGISYNAANQMTQINYGTGRVQTRTYNARLQMTRMTVVGVMDLEYRYSATLNNGQITSIENYLTGEEVNYTYDSLKRLVSAVTTGPEWGQSFGYDGFGNLLSKTVTKGSAPAWSVAVDGTTNRVDDDENRRGRGIPRPGVGGRR